MIPSPAVSPRAVPKWDWMVLLLLVAVALASRFYSATYWNIKPISALLLFAGFYFRHWLTTCFAVISIWAIMFWSDFHFGLYQWQLMVTNYIALGLAVVIGLAVRKIAGRELKGWKWLPTLAISSLTMSSLFFVLSNGAVWAFETFYSRDWTGLVECYIAGLPFFLRTLCGDLIFTQLAVGAYVYLRQFWIPVVAANEIKESFRESFKIGS